MIKADKEQVSDLALFGGQPLFMEGLHVGLPNIGNQAAFHNMVSDIFEKKWLTNDGQYVRKFETSIAALCDVKHCIAMCNGTVALGMIARALNLSGEVIMPSLTFVATAHALQWQGIQPVFCDVDPVTMTLDPAKVRKRINSKTTGIVGVHLWGSPCDIDALEAIAHEYHIPLVFDAAHALNCSYKGRKIGSFGHAEVLSFHATKVLNTFEGGAIVTNDDALASKLRLMRNFGFDKEDSVIYLGVNGKMTEIAAAMGLVNLDSLDDFIKKNKANHALYGECLSDIPGISLVLCRDPLDYNHQYVVVTNQEEKSGISRDDLHRIMQAENILVRRYFYPGCHAMEPYKSIHTEGGWDLEVTQDILNNVLILPTGMSISADHIKSICGLIHFCIKHISRIKTCLQEA